MKTSRMLVVLIVAGLVVAGLLRDGFAKPDDPKAAQTTRVAVCDVPEVFDQYTRAADLRKMFQQDGTDVEGERKKRQEALLLIREELKGLNAGSEAYEKVIERFQRQSIEHEVWLKFSEGRRKLRYKRLTQEMYDEVLAMIDRVARERRFQIVLQRDDIDIEQKDEIRAVVQKIMLRNVLYSDDSVDLTEVITEVSLKMVH